MLVAVYIKQSQLFSAKCLSLLALVFVMELSNVVNAPNHAARNLGNQYLNVVRALCNAALIQLNL